MADEPETGIGREIIPCRYSAELCGKLTKAMNRVLFDAARDNSMLGGETRGEHLITEQTRLYVYSALKLCIEEARNGG